MSHQKFDASPFTIITCRDCKSDQPSRPSNRELLEELDLAVFTVLRDIIRSPDKCTAKYLELAAQYLKIKGFTLSSKGMVGRTGGSLSEAMGKCGREFEDKDRLEDFNLPFGN